MSQTLPSYLLRPPHLVDIADEPWEAEELPDDDIVLPEGLGGPEPGNWESIGVRLVTKLARLQSVANHCILADVFAAPGESSKPECHAAMQTPKMRPWVFRRSPTRTSGRTTISEGSSERNCFHIAPSPRLSPPAPRATRRIANDIEHPAPSGSDGGVPAPPTPARTRDENQWSRRIADPTQWSRRIALARAAALAVAVGPARALASPDSLVLPAGQTAPASCKPEGGPVRVLTQDERLALSVPCPPASVDPSLAPDQSLYDVTDPRLRQVLSCVLSLLRPTVRCGAPSLLRRQ